MSIASRRIAAAIGLLTGGLFLWLALRHVDLGSVASSLRDANKWLAIPFLLSLALFYWLKAVRWAHLLRPTRVIAAGDLVPAMMIGFAGNNVLPIRLGELLRIYALSREQDLAKSTILGTVVLERVFDLLSMLVLIAAAMFATDTDSTEFEAARTFMLVAAFLAVTMTYLIVAAPSPLVRIVNPLFGWVPPRIRDNVQTKLSLLRLGFAVLTRSPGHVLFKISLNSLVQWALLAFCIYLAITAFDVDASLPIAVLILGLVVAGISLPGAPGFVGTVEYCFVLGLGLVGVGANLALSIGIYYHALTFMSVTLSGAFFLRRLNTSFRKIAKAAAEADNPNS